MTEDAERLAEIEARAERSRSVWDLGPGGYVIHARDVLWLIARVREQQNDLEICHAEHARLRECVKGSWKLILENLEPENAALRAENEKLREALENVKLASVDFAEYYKTIPFMNRIAREALEGT